MVDRIEFPPVRGKRRRLRHALGAWLGVFAVLAQGLMPLGQAVPLAGSGDPAFLVLCTAYGPRTLPAPTEPAAPDDRPWSCPVCQAGAVGDGLAGPATVSVPVPAVAREPVGAATGLRCGGASPPRPWQARAPPAV